MNCTKCMDAGKDVPATEKRWDADLCASCATSYDEAGHEASMDSGGGGQAEAMTRAYDAMEARRR